MAALEVESAREHGQGRDHEAAQAGMGWKLEAGTRDPSPLDAFDDDRAAEAADVGPRTSLAGVFVVASVLALVLAALPPLSTVAPLPGGGMAAFVWRPTRVEHFKLDVEVLRRYREAFGAELLVGMGALYILLQTVCLPGSATTLNLLAGCLYHDVMPHGEYYVALPFVVFCTAASATMCYALSYGTLCRFILHEVHLHPPKGWLASMARKVSSLKQTIEDHQDAGFWLILSMRLSPLVPSWALNLACPLAPVRVWHFTGATLIGSIPASTMHVAAGAALSRLGDAENPLLNFGNLGVLLVLATIAAVVPAALARISALKPSARAARVQGERRLVRA